LIQEGLDEGIFACSDPELAVRAVLGVLNWSITWYNPEGPLAPNAIATQFSDLLLRGLMARSEGKLQEPKVA
jgi:hypothetical protein